MTTSPLPLGGPEPGSVPASAGATVASRVPRVHDETLAPATLGDRLALAALLVGTAVVYLWRITINAMGNPFYAGAAWAGTRNWEALLFGSVDPSNFITVDKPPVSQWIMGLSGRLFGFSSASMLVPQALLGVASVALVHGIGTRVAGRRAGLLAGAALALTPVATMMFRFNNPDASMVFFMVLGAWCTVRAAQKASWRWLALAGAAMGLAFLAKMLEGLMSLPALVVLYLLAAPTTWLRKLWHLLVAAAALVVASGWYVLLTILWPASSRPYLAGSTDNSFLNLVFGYNGLARVAGKGAGTHATLATRSGAAAGSAVGDRLGDAARQHARGGFGGMGSAAGPTRMFTGEFGLEISWLIPAALVALLAVLWLRRRAPRTDLARATALMAGTWMVVDGAVLSFMNGTTHAYYTLAIAPAIALCVGIGVALAAREGTAAGRAWLAGIILAAGAWGTWLLLGVAAGWRPWIGWSVAVLTVLAVVAVLLPRRAGRLTAALVSLVAVVSMLGAPASIAVNSVGVAHTGGSPSVMPAGASSTMRGGPAGRRGGTSASLGEWGGPTRQSSGAEASGMRAGAERGGFGMGQQVGDPQLTALLSSSKATWAAATSGTESAATLELAARVPVMGIGGFTGQDPTPSLAQFQADVKAGRIGYYVVLGQGGATQGLTTRDGDATVQGGAWGGMRGGTNSVQSQILTWVKATFTPTTVGQATVYKLT